jgi:hypothetical protein
MNTKITYLLGAGASANAVPVVNNLEKVILYIRDLINPQKYTFPEINFNFEKNKTFINEISEQLEILAQKHKEFGTIDTYAKYLYLTNRKDELHKLKKYLSIFFILHQYLFYNKIPDNHFDKLDRRYLTFLISIMKENRFSEDIKILSWNYDYQIIKASQIFSDTLITVFPFAGQPINPYNLEPINVYHINGIAGYSSLREKNRSLFVDLKSMENADETNTDIFSLIRNFVDDGYLLFHFAWERKELFEEINNNSISVNGKVPDRKQNLIDHLKDSEILVVIGYSFPFFNREIDKQIFDYFKKDVGTKTIYYQNIKDNGNNLINQFNLQPNISIEFVDSKEQPNFFIPSQY